MMSIIYLWWEWLCLFHIDDENDDVYIDDVCL